MSAAGPPQGAQPPRGARREATLGGSPTSVATFLAGAASRLLPASVPFRYFGAAVAFHAAAWVALFAGADAVPRFAGGLGWLLAALHLLTLGVLAMTAIGASVQLLPVATRRAVGSARGPALLWWTYTAGVAAAALGMGTSAVPLLVAGAVLVVLALAAFAALLARNLAAADGMPVVVAHGWIALASLVITIASAISLAGSYAGAPALERTTTVALHVAFAMFGFMGMLALGFSYILVPMFALAPAPGKRPALVSAAFAAAALALAGIAAFGVAPRMLRCAAVAAGAAAIALHLRLMFVARVGGLRRELGPSFRLIHLSWVALGVTVPLALALALDAQVAPLPALFVLCAVGGWLLTFLLGMLQRIVPFLASLHAGRGGANRRPPTPSALTAESPLAVHRRCHVAALALLAFALAADSPLLVRAAALAGFVGAVAFAWFFVVVLRRMAAPRTAATTAAS